MTIKKRALKKYKNKEKDNNGEDWWGRKEKDTKNNKKISLVKDKKE